MTQQYRWQPLDYVLFAVIMSLMGGLYWGLRGTGGYGGGSGGMLAGAGWALWWYLASRRGEGAENRPYGHAWVVPAIIFGVAIGGETGYGVYISWLRGNFHYNYEDPAATVREISPWIGFFMLFLCGLHWGGVTGAFLAWCAPSRPVGWPWWCARIACGLGGAALAYWVVRENPQLYCPFYSEGIYSDETLKTVQRARTQFEPVAQHLGAFAGFLLVEIARRDRRAIAVMLTLALGFAVPFTLGAIWHLFQDAPIKLGWWKHWEFSIGLGAGAAFGYIFWRYNQPAEAPRPALGEYAEKFFAFGGPLWLVLFNTGFGAYSGWSRLHEVTFSNGMVAVIAGLCFAPMFIRINDERLADLMANDRILPLKPFALVQGSILIATLLVSIPPKLDIANYVILEAYAVCVAVSALCGWLLLSRVGDPPRKPYQAPAQRFRM